MLNEFPKIKAYVAVVLVGLVFFVWAGFSGTRLLGDDDESVENKQGFYNNSGHSGGRGYSRFYHK